jgi:hypothetical protein
MCELPSGFEGVQFLKSIAENHAPAGDIHAEDAHRAQPQFFHEPVVLGDVGFEGEAGLEKVVETQRIPVVADKGGVAEMADQLLEIQDCMNLRNLLKL